jgi:ketosteroid isomerase-like protein
MAARTQENGCKEVRRAIKSLGRSGQFQMKAAVFCRFVVLASAFFLSACTYPGTRPASKPPEKIASPPPQASTNDVPVPKPQPVTAAAPPELNLEAERNSLLEADLSFSRTCQEKGSAQAFYEFFWPDGVSLTAGEPPIRGREAIKVHLAAGPPEFFRWQPSAADVSQSADVGYTWGTGILQTKGPDEKVRIGYCKYVSVWKKQNSGRWKVVLFSTSPSPPPAERRP